VAGPGAKFEQAVPFLNRQMRGSYNCLGRGAYATWIVIFIKSSRGESGPTVAVVSRFHHDEPVSSVIRNEMPPSMNFSPRLLVAINLRWRPKTNIRKRACLQPLLLATNRQSVFPGVKTLKCGQPESW
jgi:hypothetical protein